MNIKLSLLALVALFSAEAIAADQSMQEGAARQAAASGVIAPGPDIPSSNDKKAIPADSNTADSAAKTAKGLPPYYAKVGNTIITWMDYNYEYSREARKKFYHGKPSEETTAVFQRQIGDTLVTNAMLVQEAKRRKLKPDAKFVKQQLDKYDQHFANDPNWPKARVRVLPIITKHAQNESLRTKLETLVRDVHAPSEKQLRKYYEAHPELFTAPPQSRVSTILLRVDPGAPEADWQKAAEQGMDLVKRLRAGEDFAELARQYSGDVTAEAGGDMGYLHEGMLPGVPGEIVGKLQPGETSDPVTLMEGVTIFHLTSRKPAELKSFAASRQRAKQLWLKEQSENAWTGLIAKLKKDTPVQLNESGFVPLPVAGDKPAAIMDTVKP